MDQKFAVRPLLLSALCLTVALSGCGGGSGSTPAPGAIGTLSGTAIKGPVNGATVIAYGLNSNGTMGGQIGSAVTDSMGSFTMSVNAHTGAVMLQMSGGTYKDEATGSSMTMYTGDIMTSVIPSVASGGTMTGIQITPLTSIAQTMAGLLTPANIAAANDAVGSYFSVADILHTRPMDPATAGSGTGATTDEKNYGMVIAAMTQAAKDLGMPHSSGMVTLFMEDASDGVMNGKMGANSISMSGMGGMSSMMMSSSLSTTAGTTGLASAMASFLSNTAVNRSGITAADTDMTALMNKLNSAATQTIR